MNIDITIRKATADDAQPIAVLMGELLTEIMTTIGIQVFNFNLVETAARLKDYIVQEKYLAFVARTSNEDNIGFIAMHEGYALYTEGAFGTIPELFAKPDHRATGVGVQLLSHAKSFGKSKGWKCLEVTTPPLSQFDRTMTFYERENCSSTGGRKLKIKL